jgi:hypothetical protein
MSNETVNADQYIKDLPELVSLSDTTMIPVQEESSTPETSTFFTKVSTLVTFLVRYFTPKTREIEQKSSNWTITSLDSYKIFTLVDATPSAIQCTIPSNLPIGFGFEIEDLYGREITFVLPVTELFRGGSLGVNFVVSSSEEWTTLRIRKVTSSQWNIRTN